MSVYQIRHWSKHFENHKSRGVESCRYVCMPNKQDGLGLTRILAERDGLAIFGVWCLILQACSRHQKRDGWLTDDGTENGRPWDLDDLALRWRRDPAEIRRCLDVVCDRKIAWMERLEAKCPLGGGDRPPSALKEGKEGKEGREGGLPADDELFAPSEKTPTPTTDREIANALSSVVQWYAKDADKAEANLAQIAALVRDHTREVVHAFGRKAAFRLGRLAWPNEIADEILAATTAAPTSRADLAAALVRKHGLQACVAAAGIPPAAIGRESKMVEAMVAQGDVFDAVARLGGVA